MTTFYRKVGRRYEPVSQYDSELHHAMPEGAHLVVVKPGSKFTKYNIDPNYAAMIAALMYAKDEFCQAIIEASGYKSKNEIFTDEQKLAWKKLQESFADKFYSIYTSSAGDIAEAGMKALIKEATITLENPSVKKAYEQFLLVYKLTKDES
jgi:hypothetical protein